MPWWAYELIRSSTFECVENFKETHYQYYYLLLAILNLYLASLDTVSIKMNFFLSVRLYF